MSQTVKSNNNRVYRLVLTGGPCGGKTTGQTRLCTFFESIGWKVYRVPEISAIMAGGGVKLASSRLKDEICDEMFITIYKNVLKMVIQIEKTFFDLAATCSENCLIICDGGTMDIRANLTDDQWNRVASDGGWNDVDLRDSRYNQVIHMVSAACTTNGRRRHLSSHGGLDMEVAQRRDDAVSQAWVGHPYFDIIDNSTDFDRKLMRMIAAVCDRLDIHTGDRLATDSYKRKFLIRQLPDLSLFPQFQDFTVVHDYLVTPNSRMQARIRRRGQNDSDLPMPDCCVRLDVGSRSTHSVFIHGTDADLTNWTYTHTVRCPLNIANSNSRNSTANITDGSGDASDRCQCAESDGSGSKHMAVSRDTPELKMQVSAREYELLLAQKDSNHNTVYKTRRCFLYNNQYFQMDIYEQPCPKRCNGLILLETYTSMKGDDFQVPAFLDVLKEVTGDPAYSMYNLSKKDDRPPEMPRTEVKPVARLSEHLCIENGLVYCNGVKPAEEMSAEEKRAEYQSNSYQIIAIRDQGVVCNGKVMTEYSQDSRLVPNRVDLRENKGLAVSERMSGSLHSRKGRCMSLCEVEKLPVRFPQLLGSVENRMLITPNGLTLKCSGNYVKDDNWNELKRSAASSAML